MKKKLSRDLSANALQLILNQVFGLVIFYILSTSLDKSSFGQLNLALAVLLAAFNILSLGIDQLIIKRIASGHNVGETLSLYLYHVLFTGLLFYGVLITGKLLFAQAGDTYSLLLLIGIGKLMIFFSTPFKQVVSGMERFKVLAYMLVVSNLARCICLLILALQHVITLQNIIIIFIGGDVLEFLLCIVLFKYTIKSPIALKWDKTGYIKLLREAMPQTGVVMITSALARFDWVFIGITLSAIKLAEYSFAYKVFEMSTLPLLAIAPLLIPRFTKLFQQGSGEGNNLQLLIRTEIIIAALVGLVLNVCWAPLIDGLTGGKYGGVNTMTILLLSLCMPLLYVNNFLWTIYFAKGQLKMILHSFIITLMVNVGGDLVLIPLYQNEGAAFAFLLSCLAQVIFYLKQNEISSLKVIPYTLLICTGCAVGSGFLTRTFIPNVWAAMPVSVIIFIVLLVITRQIKAAYGKQLSLLLHT
jgi:O-antigen/teichoic acid export membrane protein